MAAEAVVCDLMFMNETRTYDLPLVKHKLRLLLLARDGSIALMQGGWVYIMTNRPNGTLYVGVTSDIARRAWEHRSGAVDGFTKKYALKTLIYVERHDDIRQAIQREKNIKHWPRAWKVRLILAANPEWEDLYCQLA